MANIELDALEHIKGADGKIYEKYPVTKAKNIQGLDVKIEDKVSDAVSFVYQCTGTDDNVAINGIVNNYLASGASKNLKIVICGTLGLNDDADVFSFSGSNVVGEIHLDFENASLPIKAFSENGYWFNLDIGATNIYIKGLKIVGKNYAFSKQNAGKLTVEDSNIYIRSYIVYGNRNVTFCRCAIKTDATGGIFLYVQSGVNAQASDITTVRDCTFTNCAAYVQTSNATKIMAHFDNCQFTISGITGAFSVVNLNTVGAGIMRVSNCLMTLSGTSGNMRGIFCSGGSATVQVIAENTSIDITTTGTYECVGVHSISCNHDITINNCDIRVTGDNAASASGNTHAAVYVATTGKCYVRICKSRLMSRQLKSGGTSTQTLNLMGNSSRLGFFVIEDNVFFRPSGTTGRDLTLGYLESYTPHAIILGNSFAASDVVVQGATRTSLTNAYIYMPQYGNAFSNNMN